MDLNGDNTGGVSGSSNNPLKYTKGLENHTMVDLVVDNSDLSLYTASHTTDFPYLIKWTTSSGDMSFAKILHKVNTIATGLEIAPDSSALFMTIAD